MAAARHASRQQARCQAPAAARARRPPRGSSKDIRPCAHPIASPLAVNTCTGRLTTALRAEPERPDADESLLEEAARLVREQQQLAAQLAELQSRAGGLPTAEQAQLQRLLAAAAWPPSPPEADSGAQSGPGSAQAAEDADARQYRRYPEKEPPEQPAEVPELVRRLFEAAGVADAVPWDGRPAESQPDKPLSTEKSRVLEEFMLQAGRPPPAPDQADKPWQGFGDGIPDGPEADDDEYVEGDDKEFILGEGVEQLCARLEAGEPLPPDPAYAGTTPESHTAFRARLDKWAAAYEAQFMDRKDWKISPEEFKRMWDVEISDDFPPWDPPEILEVQPAPEWPPEVQQHYDRFQWLLYRLRRAHMQGSPAAPAQALLSAGLAAEDMQFHDEVLESRGSRQWLDYAQRLEAAGVRSEAGNFWGEMGNERPHPQWRVLVDGWHSLPYPAWSLSYFEQHAQHPEPPNLGPTMPDGRPPPDPYEPQPDYWEPPPLRGPKGRPRAERDAEPAARGFGARKSRGKERAARTRVTPPAAPAAEPATEPAAPDADGEDGAEAPRDVFTGCALMAAFTSEWDMALPPVERRLPGEDAHPYLAVMRELQARLADAGSAATQIEVDLSDAGGCGDTSGRGSRFFHTGHPWRRFQYADASQDPWSGPPDRRRHRRGVAHRVLGWEQPEDADLAEVEALLAKQPSFGGPAAAAAAAAAAAQELAGAARPAQRSRLLSTVRCEAAGGSRPVSFQVLSYGKVRAAPGRPRLGWAGGQPPAWPGGSGGSGEVGQAWRSGDWMCIPWTTIYSIDNARGQVTKVTTEWGALLGHSLADSQDLVDLYLRQLRLWEAHDPASQRVKLYRPQQDVPETEQQQAQQQQEQEQ